MSESVKEPGTIESYFKKNAESWISDAYEDVGYNYPVGFHRMRIVKQIIQGLNEVQRIIDVGCGGGHLLCALAQKGYDVLGVDQSEEMIVHAKTNINNLKPEIAERIKLHLGSLEKVASGPYDAMTAMGVIGYFPSDKILFEIGSRILRNRGYMIISFRNRLFNLYSISHETIQEVETGKFSWLVSETLELYRQIDKGDLRLFLKSLHNITREILEDGSLDNPVTSATSPSKAKGKEYSSVIEARQTTPKQAMEVAKDCGYETVKLYGVHPHINLPSLNEMLPFQIYNRLSDSLIPLEKTLTSLLWSSVFIGVFQKN